MCCAKEIMGMVSRQRSVVNTELFHFLPVMFENRPDIEIVDLDNDMMAMALSNCLTRRPCIQNYLQNHLNGI